MYGSVMLFSKRVLGGTPMLRIGFDLLWFTSAGLHLVSQFSTHATVYFFSIAATLLASLFILRGRWLLAFGGIFVGICGYQTNLYLFFANMLLIYLVDLNRGQQRLCLQHWVATSIVAFLSFSAYEITLHVLSNLVYGMAPEIASWRLPNYPVDLGSLTDNVLLLFSSLLKNPIYDVSSTIILCGLMLVMLGEKYSKNAKFFVLCVISALALRVLLESTAIVVGVAQPMRGLHMYFYVPILLGLPLFLREPTTKRFDAIIGTGLCLIVLTSAINNYVVSNLYIQKANCQVENLQRIIISLKGEPKIERLTLISYTTEPPLIMDWFPLNAYYYFGPLGYPVNISFDSTQPPSKVLNLDSPHLTVWREGQEYFAHWQESSQDCYDSTTDKSNLL
tara:strand:- start:2159 stop:3334 length:1176 start_codon:yes stop_codon:yes gene_type:complete